MAFGPSDGIECPKDYDPGSPAYIFIRDSPIMEEGASSNELMFSIHMEYDSFCTYDATDPGADLDKSEQALSSGEAGDNHKRKECHLWST